MKANADYMAEKLAVYGWEYVVVDIRWFVENDKAGGYNQTNPIYVYDEWGRYTPALNRFPSAANGVGFRALADYVHGKGLKFGMYSCAGVRTCAGYPGSYEKGKVITGIEDAEAMENVTVYHAGTAVVDGQLVTNGGRVLAVTALGDTFENARNLAYEACEKIDFEGKTLRHDIGLRALRGRDAWDA